MSRPVTNYVCPVCGRRMMGPHERCSGSFLDAHHPPNVGPVVGNPPIRDLHGSEGKR